MSTICGYSCYLNRSSCSVFYTTTTHNFEPRIMIQVTSAKIKDILIKRAHKSRVNEQCNDLNRCGTVESKPEFKYPTQLKTETWIGENQTGFLSQGRTFMLREWKKWKLCWKLKQDPSAHHRSQKLISCNSHRGHTEEVMKLNINP